MKAWACIDWEEDVACIVFAETRSKARALALGSPGFEFSDFISIEVRRRERVDCLRSCEMVADWRDDADVYYNAKFWRGESNSLVCKICNRHEYQEFPQSRVVNAVLSEGVCLECLKGDGGDE